MMLLLLLTLLLLLFCCDKLDNVMSLLDIMTVYFECFAYLEQLLFYIPILDLMAVI